MNPRKARIIDRSERRKHLEERLRILHTRAIAIEDSLKSLEDNRYYRVCIFGSARIKQEDQEYQEVYELARMLAWDGMDILTGGGPGLMEAANKGVKHGQEEKKSRSLSFGLGIKLPWEQDLNSHVDIKHHHLRFSSRLDQFMQLSHSVVCTPGGIGTLLEVFFTLQLIQVGHITKRPVVLMDASYWEGMMDWIKAVPLKRGLISAKDLDGILIADTPAEVYEIISKHHKEFVAERQKQSSKKIE